MLNMRAHATNPQRGGGPTSGDRCTGAQIHHRYYSPAINPQQAQKGFCLRRCQAKLSLHHCQAKLRLCRRLHSLPGTAWTATRSCKVRTRKIISSGTWRCTAQSATNRVLGPTKSLLPAIRSCMAPSSKIISNGTRNGSAWHATTAPEVLMLRRSRIIKQQLGMCFVVKQSYEIKLVIMSHIFCGMSDGGRCNGHGMGFLNFARMMV